MEYFISLSIATVLLTFAGLLWKKALVWWEYGAVLLACLLTTAGVSGLCKVSKISDFEYWGGWVVQASYYEAWDERVSCRHPIYETTCDSDNNCTTTYVGDEHSYDVDYHPPKWAVEESNGFVRRISQQTYLDLKRRLGNEAFQDLGRIYHSQDGDMYYALYQNGTSEFIPATTMHYYQNKVQQDQGVYKYEEVDPKKYKVFDYPKDQFFDSPAAIGEVKIADRPLQDLNARLGALKKFRLWVVTFDSSSSVKDGLRQEAYWKGSNKNELVVCLGLDKNKNILWSHVFTWSESYLLKQEVKDYLDNSKWFDVPSFAEWLEPKVVAQWEKREWSDFDHISVSLSPAQLFWTIVLSVVATCGVLYVSVMNSTEN